VVRRPVARSGKATPNLVSLLAGPVSLRSSGCRHVLCRGRMRGRLPRCMEPLWRRAVILDLISFPRSASVCGRPEGSCAMPEDGRIICRTLRWRTARPNARTRTPTTRLGVTVLFACSYDVACQPFGSTYCSGPCSLSRGSLADSSSNIPKSRNSTSRPARLDLAPIAAVSLYGSALSRARAPLSCGVSRAFRAPCPDRRHVPLCGQLLIAASYAVCLREVVHPQSRFVVGVPAHVVAL
jgi:hypothetical protein